jgi:Cu/Ag efflux pump CusA
VWPDRARGAQYDIKIEDVNQLINTALGGEPIATLCTGASRGSV